MSPRKRARTSGASARGEDTPTKDGISQELQEDLIARAKNLPEMHGKIVDHIVSMMNKHGGVSPWYPTSACSLRVFFHTLGKNIL